MSQICKYFCGKRNLLDNVEATKYEPFHHHVKHHKMTGDCGEQNIQQYSSRVVSLETIVSAGSGNIVVSAVKRSIGSTTGFHNHGEGLVESAY